ncbi:NERD domain-containing protein [Pseudoalteromonas luteoviolacea]|uniref:NERD domain-containing protein n=1 Tax=Pseudoalteromonas luteoviolacea S4054 TaxID=1129367 RepID=A0A0F6A5F4_9GAMM|nr:NERD domain-containing protein [Pseudoalteromonas luteoviolacea]AOT10469.1 hypothetical protein S4054249_21610 [Pseudoalteromonas luteoviolacea]AOT15462.1 hypothetical protein S40542_21985 [Pseudoalteromonas luteoviolacea]AOT20288.1 hypothetical protein S4054_21525 [Pseudoalteromonas luteoviolacea]KKE81415.1 hypothetical protein N479_02735 [Pseudoalteromonas luteoviolacea S4054]KZN71688.1 hypothetical protein N481_18645 [Pseudoalteromonas luteoviolacea S4047-1]
MNRWILFLLIYAGCVASNPIQLDVNQCDRYASELVFLQNNSNLTGSEQARITRLLERVAHYCQSPSKVELTSAETNVSPSIYGTNQFKDPKVYQRWQAFFQKPIICHDGEQNFQSAVKCAEQVAKQRQAFEAQLAEQNRRNEINRRSNIIFSAPVITESVASAKPLGAVQYEASNFHTLNISQEPEHFARFGFWLSIVLGGYLLIELGKRVFFHTSSASYKTKKIGFKGTFDALSSKLDKKKYIIIPQSMSPLLQELDIDGVVLSPYGIFTFVCVHHEGDIEANLSGEMWHASKEGSSQFFLNPLNASKMRASKFADSIGASCGVRQIVAFNKGVRFYPGQPINCFDNSQVAIEVMRYTQFIFSYEQLRYFEQGLYAASHRLSPSQQTVS